MADEAGVKPLITESSTSESTTVEVAMNEMRDQSLRIPDYQRDADQWDDTTKSLFIESIINNLTVPAFFFEPKIENDIEINEVVDGQQRLTTLYEFYKNKFRLVPSELAGYLSPNSIHYSNKTFDELPVPYQRAFKIYRLTIIKLRQLNHMRLEVFRRINQGGTPLSGHDIRLAYYGEESKTVTFIRLAGIYDKDRPASKRFIESAKRLYSLDHPWDGHPLETWNEWWSDKEIARGQAASESFLLGIVAANHNNLDKLLTDASVLSKLNIRFNGAMDEALDASIAQFQYQDKNPTFPPILIGFNELKEKFFPYYKKFIDKLLAEKSPHLPVSKNRMISSFIGSCFTQEVDLTKLSNESWTRIENFIKRPQEEAKKTGIEWPQSKGRWDGQKGYRAQFEAIHQMVKKIC